MQLNDILQKSTRGKKRVGRGGKRGHTSGRGTKGQKSRAGRKIRPMMRDLVQKIPKKRGTGFSATSGPVVTVDLGTIDAAFNAGEKVTPRVLHNRGIVDLGRKTPRPRVKVLARGTLAKKLILENVDASQRAAQQILKLGGEVRHIERN